MYYHDDDVVYIKYLIVGSLFLIGAYYQLWNPLYKWEFISFYDDNNNFEWNEQFQQDCTGIWNMTGLFQSKLEVFEPVSWIWKSIVFLFCGCVLDARFIRMSCLLLHGVTMYLIFAFVLRLSKLTHSKTSNIKSYHGAFLASLFFGVHPVHVEVVMWPSAVGYPLATCLALLSALIVTNTEILESRVHLYAAVVLFFLSTFAKASAIPIISVYSFLLFCQYTSRGKPSLIGFINILLPFIISCAVAVCGTLIGNYKELETRLDPINISLAMRLIASPMMYSDTVFKLIWPHDLHLEQKFPFEDITLENANLILSTVFVILWGGWAVWRCVQLLLYRLIFPRGKPEQFSITDIGAMVSVCFFFMKLPYVGIFRHGKITLNADRYSYCVNALVVAPAVGMLLQYAEHFCMGNQIYRVVVAWVLCFTFICQRESIHWQSSYSVCEHALRTDYSNWSFLTQCGDWFFKYAQDTSVSKPYYEKVLIHGPSPSSGERAFLLHARLDIMYYGNATKACERYEGEFQRQQPNPSPYIINNHVACMALFDFANRKPYLVQLFKKALQDPRIIELDLPRMHTNLECLENDRVGDIKIMF